MFVSMARQQRVQSPHDVELTWAQFIVLVRLLAPVMLMAIVWATAAAIIAVSDITGLPGGDYAASFLDDTLWLQILSLAYVVAVSANVCAASDRVSTKLAVWWAFTTISFNLSPKVVPWVVQFLETLGSWTNAQPVLATPGGLRPAIRPQLPIPALRFSPGVSPQLE